MKIQSNGIRIERRISCVEYHDVFNLFDKAKTGKIPAEQMSMAMRLAGQAPTEADIRRILADLEKEARMLLGPAIR